MTLWVSCSKMTGTVDIREDGIITRTSPIFKKFAGQPIDNLRKWMGKLGEYKEEDISEEPTNEED